MTDSISWGAVLIASAIGWPLYIVAKYHSQKRDTK